MKGKVQSSWFHFLHLLANQEQNFNNLWPSFEAVNKVLKSQRSGLNLHGFQAAKAWEEGKEEKTVPQSWLKTELALTFEDL